MSTTPEGRVKAAVKKRLHHYGVYPFTELTPETSWVTGTYYMPVAGPFSVHGVHDFVGCWHGVFWSIETKAPNNPEDETHHQGLFRVAVSASGGISLTGVRDASAVDELHRLVKERINTLVKEYAW